MVNVCPANVCFTPHIVMRYQARSVNRASRATHSDIRSLTQIPSENIGCERRKEGDGGLQREKGRRREKKKK